PREHAAPGTGGARAAALDERPRGDDAAVQILALPGGTPRGVADATLGAGRCRDREEHGREQRAREERPHADAWSNGRAAGASPPIARRPAGSTVTRAPPRRECAAPRRGAWRTSALRAATSSR